MIMATTKTNDSNGNDNDNDDDGNDDERERERERESRGLKAIFIRYRPPKSSSLATEQNLVSFAIKLD